MSIKETIFDIKDNVILLSLICYGFGFVFNLIYYFHFNIPIIYYLSLNDLLLFAITYILPLVICVFLCEYIFYILLSKKLNYLYTLITKKNVNPIWSDLLSLIFFILTCFLSLLLADKAIYSMPSFLFFFISLPICVNAKRHLAESKFHLLPSDLILIGVTIIFGVFGTTKITETGISMSYISFLDKESNKLIDTGENFDLIYIGETSTNVFLYNCKSKVSYSFKKDHLTSLKYYKDDAIDVFNPISIKKLISINGLKSAQVYDSANHKKTNIWFKMKKDIYIIKFDQSPKGINSLFSEVKDILKNNNLDYEKPIIDDSFLTSETKNLDDFEKLNSAIKRSAAEINKIWALDESSISITLNKDFYNIMVVIKN